MLTADHNRNINSLYLCRIQSLAIFILSKKRLSTILDVWTVSYDSVQLDQRFIVKIYAPQAAIIP